MAKKNKKFILLKNLFLLGGAIFVFALGFGILWISSFQIPDFNSFKDRRIINSTKLYDRTGKVLLYDIHQDIKRTSIPFGEMGLHIKNATVSIEDSEFYNHAGIRITSIIRAIIYNFLGKTQGGSTITQQLVKNTLLTQEKTYVRKIKEWVLAMKIDQTMSKERILEYYLNEIPYGGNVYGIEEAAKTFFSKKAKDLTLAEAAYLAAIPQAPTTYSPYKKNRDKLEARKNLVLSKMLSLKFISQKEYDEAKKEIVVFTSQDSLGIKAPHFVFFIKNYLEQKYKNEMLNQGGLKVITTLDYNLQEKGEKIVKEGALNNKKINGENAALVAIDPKTGQILSMVGSRDYFDKQIDGNYNIATATRQPGSSFKPFIYATAFAKGFTPETVLFDLPTEFQTTCDPYGKAFPGYDQKKCYMPDNYNDKFVGPISLRSALAQSINVPAVKLFYLAGLKDSLKTAEDLGISTLVDSGRYGLTLVIGGGEVKLLDITSAYGVFANNGIRNKYTGILKIENSQGNVLEEFNMDGKKVMDKNIALTVSDLLSDNEARVPTFGPNSNLFIPGKKVAAKTGTTNSNRDAWLIGYTPSITVGVWAGNNNNAPMKKGGVGAAGPIWNKFMLEALKTIPDEEFEKPAVVQGLTLESLKPVLRGIWQGGESFFIDKISGKLATDYTPKETRQEKILTNVHSILYWLDKKDIFGITPINPGEDSQFGNWETAVQDWWAKNKSSYPITTELDKPNTFDDIHSESSKPIISILEPNVTTTYLPDQKIQLKISSSGKFPLSKIHIFVNDVYLGNSLSPFNFSFIPTDLDNLKKINEVKIIAQDIYYNQNEVTTIFNVQN
jgi:1A family penicillin-binding protein